MKKSENKITINEETLYNIVKESFKRILEEGYYENKNVVDMISSNLSSFRGVRVSDEYTNIDRVVLELPSDYNEIGRLLDKMHDLGYKCYSSSPRYRKSILVFKRK